MLDYLEIEIPFGMPMKRGFARSWYDPGWNEKLVKKKDALYAVTADLRPLGIPAQLFLDHKHHKRLGPKLRIIGVGDLNNPKAPVGYSDWVGIPNLIFDGDVEDAAPMRIDCTSDVPDVRVSDFAGALWCNRKLVTRTEYGERLSAEIQRQGAQTKYYGKKPRQFRIYNKTLHRLLELLPQHNRERKRKGLPPQTFMEVYGYDPIKILTRAERQMGNREVGEIYGIKHLGDLHRLMNVDPFDKFKFRVDCKKRLEMDDMKPEKRILIGFLQEMNRREGLDAVRSHVREYYVSGKNPGNSFRYAWNGYARFIIEENPAISAEFLTAEFRRTLSLQLAA